MNAPPFKRLALVGLLAFATACDEPTISEAPGPAEGRPVATGGPADDVLFQWLPPIGKNRRVDGIPNTQLTPEVDICVTEPEPPHTCVEMIDRVPYTDIELQEDGSYKGNWKSDSGLAGPLIAQVFGVADVGTSAPRPVIGDTLLFAIPEGGRGRGGKSMRTPGSYLIQPGQNVVFRFKAFEGVLCEDFIPANGTDCVEGNYTLAGLVSPQGRAAVQASADPGDVDPDEVPTTLRIYRNILDPDVDDCIPGLGLTQYFNEEFGCYTIQNLSGTVLHDADDDRGLVIICVPQEMFGPNSVLGLAPGSTAYNDNHNWQHALRIFRQDEDDLTIEELAPRSTSAFGTPPVDCKQWEDYTTASAAEPGTSRFASLVERASDFTRGLFEPQELYAIAIPLDFGRGGEMEEFSTFVVAMPALLDGPDTLLEGETCDALPGDPVAAECTPVDPGLDLTDNGGQPYRGAQVTLTVGSVPPGSSALVCSDGSCSDTEVTVPSAPDGSVPADWYPGPVPGEYELIASIAGTQQSITITVDAEDACGGFSGTAVVDGVVGEDEWACAAGPVVGVDPPTFYESPGAAPAAAPSIVLDETGAPPVIPDVMARMAAPAPVYVRWMEDAGNLYVAVQVRRPANEETDGLLVVFDPEYPAGVSSGDDARVLFMRDGQALYFDKHAVPCSWDTTRACPVDDAFQQGEGAISVQMIDGVRYVSYEFSVPYTGESTDLVGTDGVGWIIQLASDSRGFTEWPGIGAYQLLQDLGGSE